MILKRLIVLCFVSLFFTGCYEFIPGETIYIKYEFDKLPEGSNLKLCADVAYYESSKPNHTEIQTVCSESVSVSLQRPQLAIQVFKQQRSDQVFVITNLANIKLVSTTNPQKCEDCVVSILEQVYGGTLVGLASVEKPLSAQVNFNLESEKTIQYWVSSYEKIARGCGKLKRKHSVDLCLQKKVPYNVSTECSKIDPGFSDAKNDDKQYSCIANYNR